MWLKWRKCEKAKGAWILLQSTVHFYSESRAMDCSRDPQ